MERNMICFHKLLDPYDGDARIAVEYDESAIGKNVRRMVQAVRDEKSKRKWRRFVCG
jgi:hypothetical protein